MGEGSQFADWTVKHRIWVARNGIALALAVSCGACVAKPHLYVKTSQDTNRGKPLHMMIRAADERRTFAETYSEVAAKAYQAEVDPSVLAVEVVIPGGKDLVVPLDAGSDQDIVLYFFFTEPGGTRWFVPISTPLPDEIYVELGENTISNVRVR